MAKNFQIIQLNSAGIPTVFHPETNADNVLTGLTYKIPTIININDWNDKSTEVTAARKGKSSLKLKIDEIDNALTPTNLLTALKTVDGSESGLDADTVDGKQVDDSTATVNNIWTAKKTNDLIGTKISTTEMASIATPDKLLKLNSSGRLAADVEGNAKTATSLARAVSFNLTGDVSGSFSLVGNEDSPIVINTAVKDDSHNHSSLVKGASSLSIPTTADIAEFKKNGVALSKIDERGDFTGSAAAVNGISVNNKVNTNSIWTSEKIIETISSLITLDELSGSIDLGAIKIKYGTIALNGLSETFATVSGLTKILFDGFTLETSEKDLICTKKPGTTASKISYALNKQATNGKLIWFAVGV